MGNVRHFYVPLLRPATHFGVPRGWNYSEAPGDIAHMRPDLPVSKYRHGVIYYSHALTPEQVEDLSLQYLGCVLVFEDLDMDPHEPRHEPGGPWCCDEHYGEELAKFSFDEVIAPGTIKAPPGPDDETRCDMCLQRSPRRLCSSCEGQLEDEDSQ